VLINFGVSAERSFIILFRHALLYKQNVALVVDIPQTNGLVKPHLVERRDDHGYQTRLTVDLEVHSVLVTESIESDGGLRAPLGPIIQQGNESLSDGHFLLVITYELVIVLVVVCHEASQPLLDGLTNPGSILLIDNSCNDFEQTIIAALYLYFLKASQPSEIIDDSLFFLVFLLLLSILSLLF